MPSTDWKTSPRAEKRRSSRGTTAPCPSSEWRRPCLLQEESAHGRTHLSRRQGGGSAATPLAGGTGSRTAKSPTRPRANPNGTDLGSILSTTEIHSAFLGLARGYGFETFTTPCRTHENATIFGGKIVGNGGRITTPTTSTSTRPSTPACDVPRRSEPASCSAAEQPGRRGVRPGDGQLLAKEPEPRGRSRPEPELQLAVRSVAVPRRGGAQRGVGRPRVVDVPRRGALLGALDAQHPLGLRHLPPRALVPRHPLVHRRGALQLGHRREPSGRPGHELPRMRRTTKRAASMPHRPYDDLVYGEYTLETNSGFMEFLLAAAEIGLEEGREELAGSWFR
ncbi:hypothetical protein DL766_005712 [Monosporascus sp. MC13-8B]|uniref:Uncharacterized protein n=1 Tax=Monosporascus cannonballus TaxID=155416 RepID=A0ABY0H0I8_9PEZI|nr:hypothetical protein DL762_006991 [Monosporascus cannonballus]RYO86077.1 hypothetical protein DL763_006858 [Monosporascus cannonballus]RYP28753.1 hypothetical protein DL766_005712 [Monosporascus sp. MC13-8B]